MIEDGTYGSRKSVGCLEPRKGGNGWGHTHVTSKETKKRSATFVYPNAALFASMAALLFRCASVECVLGVMGGRGASNLGLSGAEAMVTEYWS